MKINKEVLGKVIKNGELTRARLLLDSLGLAPGTPETLTELSDPALRPPELTTALPEKALEGDAPDVD